MITRDVRTIDSRLIASIGKKTINKEFKITKLKIISIILFQGCPTQISWRAKTFYLPYPRARMICSYPFKGCIYQENKLKLSTKFWAKRAKLKAFAGHIWPAGRMLCMPVLYVLCFYC